MALIKRITAIERDGLDVKVMTMEFEILDKEIELKEAVRKACAAYMKTLEGAAVYRGNCRNFNWGDFWEHVPNDVCRKHGFLKKNDIVAENDVDWDEQLFDGGDKRIQTAEDIVGEFFGLLKKHSVNADLYIPKEEELFEKVYGVFMLMENKAEMENVYTHDWAARILDFFEDMLSDIEVVLPSPEDDESHDGCKKNKDGVILADELACLYGSTYSDLIDTVEEILSEWAESVIPGRYVNGKFSSRY